MRNTSPPATSVKSAITTAPGGLPSRWIMGRSWGVVKTATTVALRKENTSTISSPVTPAKTATTTAVGCLRCMITVMLSAVAAVAITVCSRPENQPITCSPVLSAIVATPFEAGARHVSTTVVLPPSAPVVITAPPPRVNTHSMW